MTMPVCCGASPLLADSVEDSGIVEDAAGGRMMAGYALTGVTRIADINGSALATETIPEETHVLELAETRKKAGGR